MWPYVIFGLSCVALGATGKSRRLSTASLIVTFSFLVFFIGLRHQVGPDWISYLRLMKLSQSIQSSADLWFLGEPFYAFLLIIADWSGYEIYFANAVVAAIFAFGLMSFVRTVPEPWMGFIAAVPSLIIAVSTSANRQTAAIGILLWLFANWERSGLWRRVLVIALAAGFHFSALIILIFVGMTLTINLGLKLIASGILLTVMLYVLSAVDQINYYNSTYGTGQTVDTQSQGALLHVSFNALPALLYFLLPGHRPILFPTPLLRQMAIVALAMLPLAFYASTAASRISFYWYPVSIWVLGALPLTFQPESRSLIRTSICTLQFMLMMIWLNFANMAPHHLPYQNALFIESWRLDLSISP